MTVQFFLESKHVQPKGQCSGSGWDHSATELAFAHRSEKLSNYCAQHP